MRHDWIFEVLNDLRSYAQKNDLPALAEQAERTLRIARAEIASRGSDPEQGGTGGDDGPPPSNRRH